MVLVTFDDFLLGVRTSAFLLLVLFGGGVLDRLGRGVLFPEAERGLAACFLSAFMVFLLLTVVKSSSLDDSTVMATSFAAYPDFHRLLPVC